MQIKVIDTLGKYLRNVRLNDLKKLHPEFSKEQEAEHLAGFSKKFMADEETYVLVENGKLFIRPLQRFLLSIMKSFRENPGLQYCGDEAFELFFMTCYEKWELNFGTLDTAVEVITVVASEEEVEEEMKKDPVDIAVKKKSKKK